MSKFRIILLLIALTILFAGVNNASEQEKKAEVVGNKVCPVSGEKIDENMKQTYEYKGKIYNFCCPICVEEFKKDPEKYIEELEKSDESKGHEGQEKHHHHGH